MIKQRFHQASALFTLSSSSSDAIFPRTIELIDVKFNKLIRSERKVNKLPSALEHLSIGTKRVTPSAPPPLASLYLSPSCLSCSRSLPLSVRRASSFSQRRFLRLKQLKMTNSFFHVFGFLCFFGFRR